MAAAAPFSAALDSLAASAPKRASGASADAPTDVYVPNLPRLLCLSRAAAASPLLRDLLVVRDGAPAIKPRLSWYNPFDTTWFPTGWLEDGLVADLNYYIVPSLKHARRGAARSSSSAASGYDSEDEFYELGELDAAAMEAYAAAWVARSRLAVY